ncbi:MAG TPA: hypothetical protein VFH60_10340 [Chloroflexia bacterium]|nr:hypothetical protein [Chloroflexia bacterium]
MNANSSNSHNGNHNGNHISSQALSVLSLFADAHDEGDLSKASFQALSVPDLGAQIQAAMGVPALDVPATRAILLTLLLDDSGSIAAGGNEQAVRDGYNEVVKALRESRQADDILAQCSYLNRGILYPYEFIGHVPLLDVRNFSAYGITPLYDRAIVTLGAVLAKSREFTASGVPTNTVTLIVTDGHDEGSVHRARDVYPIVQDMLAQESHIVAGMGIDDGDTDFRAVFRSMGVPDNWILTPRSDPKEIRQAFQLFSRSAISASQSQATFSQTAASGFTVGGFGV